MSRAVPAVRVLANGDLSVDLPRGAALLWGPLILVTTLAPLRPMKGLMIALQYLHKAAEGRPDQGDV